MIVGIVVGDLVINFFKINCEVFIQMVFCYVNCYLVIIDVIFFGCFDVKLMVMYIYDYKDV